MGIGCHQTADDDCCGNCTKENCTKDDVGYLVGHLPGDPPGPSSPRWVDASGRVFDLVPRSTKRIDTGRVLTAGELADVIRNAAKITTNKSENEIWHTFLQRTNELAPYNIGQDANNFATQLLEEVKEEYPEFSVTDTVYLHAMLAFVFESGRIWESLKRDD